jgi:hypothetical protein
MRHYGGSRKLRDWNLMSHSFIYADDVNLLGKNISIIKKGTEALLDASKEVGREVDPGKTVSSPNCRTKIIITTKVPNKSFEKLSKFKYIQPYLDRYLLVRRTDRQGKADRHTSQLLVPVAPEK